MQCIHHCTRCAHVQHVPVQYEDQWKRRDVLGVHPQRQQGLYWVGALVPVGRLHSEDMDAFADIAER